MYKLIVHDIPCKTGEFERLNEVARDRVNKRFLISLNMAMIRAKFPFFIQYIPKKMKVDAMIYVNDGYVPKAKSFKWHLVESLERMGIINDAGEDWLDLKIKVKNSDEEPRTELEIGIVVEDSEDDL